MALYQKLGLILAVSLLGLLSVLWARRDLDTRPFDESAIPASLGTWTSYANPVTDLEISILQTNQIFGRSYVGPEGAFFLSLVYYPNGVVNFHHPEGCTRAVGAQLLDHQPIRLDGAWPGSRGTYFRIQELDGRSTHYAYAFCTPYEAHGDYLEFRKHLAWTSLKQGRTACALIRISTAAPTPELAQAALQKFWDRISPELLRGFGAGR